MSSWFILGPGSDQRLSLERRRKPLPAKVVTRVDHLLALAGNRIRTGADWLLDAALSHQVVQLGLVPGSSVRLDCTAMPGPLPVPDDCGADRFHRRAADATAGLPSL